MNREKPHINRDGSNRVGSASNGSSGGGVFAAIDLGTNACRLLVAVPEGTGMRVIGSYSASVRLGEGLAREGAFTDDGISRAVTALKDCAAQMVSRGVTRVRAIATEACRRAANANALITRARDEAGIELEIITPAQEVELAVAGCSDLIGDEYEGALVFDIGGGSTELILVRRVNGGTDVTAWCSVPTGVVTLAEKNGGTHLPAWLFAPMRAEMDAMLSREHAGLTRNGFEPSRFHLLGTSGTLTTLMAVKLGLLRYDRRRIDGQWLDRADVEALISRIVVLDFDERAAIPGVGEDRADLILPGLAILSAIMEQWQCARLRVADRGLREGILAALMAAETAPGSPAAADGSSAH
jgi:exopolyphosphatase / guanosine-5'-triphosphate,3'-diphosphate pyrophosphatase